MEQCIINVALDGAAEIDFDGQSYLRTTEGNWYRSSTNLSANDDDGGTWDNRSLALMLENVVNLTIAVDHMRLGG